MGKERKYGVIFAGDLLADPTIVRRLQAHWIGGPTVGLLDASQTDQPGQQLRAELSACLKPSRVELIETGRRATVACDLLVLISLSAMLVYPEMLGRIRPRRVCALFDADELAPWDNPATALQFADATATAIFGAQPLWLPANRQARAFIGDNLLPVQTAATNWPPVIAVRDLAGRAGRQPTSPAAFFFLSAVDAPSQAEAALMERMACDSRFRMLGLTRDAARLRLAGRLEAHYHKRLLLGPPPSLAHRPWSMQHLAEGLAKSTFAVAFPDPATSCADDVTLLSALAEGVVVFTAPLQDEAGMPPALHCRPEEVPELAAELLAQAARRHELSFHGVRHISDWFGSQTYLRVLATLLQ